MKLGVTAPKWRSWNLSWGRLLPRTTFLPSLQFPSKGGSRHHHFVFSQGGCLAACQSQASGSQVLTKHRPEQEGGARGSAGASWLLRPLPCTPTSSNELRAAGAATADNSKLLPPLLGRR